MIGQAGFLLQRVEKMVPDMIRVRTYYIGFDFFIPVVAWVLWVRYMYVRVNV